MEVLQNDDGDTQNYKPGGRLDMNHGFLHHIRRNQIARDDYDREVKQAREQQKRRHTAAPRRPRRPDREVYHPRHGSSILTFFMSFGVAQWAVLSGGSDARAGGEAEEWNESSSSTGQENTGNELFWLDYQADNGNLTSFLVFKEDEPENVVERVEQKNVLDTAVRAALLARISQEMDKRREKH